MMHMSDFSKGKPASDAENGADPEAEICLGRVSGAKAGPVLAVLGDRRDLSRAIDRLRAIPSLSYLRGEIAFFDVSRCAATDLESFDDILVTGSLDRALDTSDAADKLYWSILGRSAELGQITGRGVPVLRNG